MSDRRKPDFDWRDPLFIEDLLDEEERMIRDAARDFAQKRLMPLIRDWHRHETFDPDIMRELGDMGFLGMQIEGYGCAGASYTAYGLVARELERETKLVIAAQPTRGLDVGSIEYIHSRLMDARDEGDGVIIVSSELDEIMSLSDRILVMFDGRIVAEFDATAGPVDKNAVGLAMAGAHE